MGYFRQTLLRLGAAIQFLTLLPVPGMPVNQQIGLAHALLAFPIVGGLIGLLLSGVWLFAGLWWPGLPQAALVVVAWALITGGLHLDGLSDTFDGVMSWRPREQKLAIMKDSRIGAMGTLAIAAILLLKTAFVGQINTAWPILLAAPILGRWAMILAICHFPPATATGMGATVQQEAPRWLPLAALLLTAGCVGVAAGLAGWLAMLLVVGLVLVIGRWWAATLGGLTGDTYGALCELAEVLALAALLAASANLATTIAAVAA
jgi:adenosylcobinamide-GDP ribazoletransferase